ncbi:MAG: pyridoxamine 5'-phosphate oxidase family protein [Oscillospiraceae bacterium]|nr:pyridoxamine 5'-phosphate oxidase family protein [Oscillospiraceae bacterium]
MREEDKIALTIMNERFGHDTLISLATLDGDSPSVRIVDALYENGSFYVVTYTLSNKIRHINENPKVAVCGEWFTATGLGENLGWVRDDQNTEMMKKLRDAFSEWYDNGHVNEEDENTCLLEIQLSSGILFNQGAKYEIDFEKLFPKG